MFTIDAPLKAAAAAAANTPPCSVQRRAAGAKETTAKGKMGEMTYRPRSVSSLLIRFSAILCGLFEVVGVEVGVLEVAGFRW